MKGKKTAGKWACFAIKSTRPWLLALICAMCTLAAGCSMLGTRRIAAEPTPSLPPALLELLNPLKGVDPANLVPCPPELPAAKGDDVDLLIRNHVDSAGVYHDCRIKQSGLARDAVERERLESERIERARKAMGWTK